MGTARGKSCETKPCAKTHSVAFAIRGSTRASRCTTETKGKKIARFSLAENRGKKYNDEEEKVKRGFPFGVLAGKMAKAIVTSVPTDLEMLGIQVN